MPFMVRRGVRQLRIDPERFWQQPDKWPLDAEGKVFLGRAVLHVAAAQLEPPEPISHPLTDRVSKSYRLAEERIAKAAAAGELKTFVLSGSRFTPIRPVEWATLDRSAVFRSLCRYPGKIYTAGAYSDSKAPIYVEARSLAGFVKFTVTAARAAEATATFQRVTSDRFSIAKPPAIHPPAGFLSIDQALDALRGQSQAEKAQSLRSLLASGRLQANLQFWETGNIDGIAADYWVSDEAVEALSDNGVVSIPEDPHTPNSYPLLAYVRVRTVPVQEPLAQEDQAEPDPATANPAKTKRARSSAGDEAKAIEIRDLRRAIQTVATESGELLTIRNLARKTSEDHLKAPEKFETIRQIIAGNHVVSNRLIELGLLTPFMIKVKSG